MKLLIATAMMAAPARRVPVLRSNKMLAKDGMDFSPTNIEIYKKINKHAHT
jgi:hypothetical protein